MKQPEFLLTNINGIVTLKFFYTTGGTSPMKEIHLSSTEEGMEKVFEIVKQNEEGKYDCVRGLKNIYCFKLIDTNGHIICESEERKSYRNCQESIKNFQRAVAQAKLILETTTREEIDIHALKV